MEWSEFNLQLSLLNSIQLIIIWTKAGYVFPKLQTKLQRNEERRREFLLVQIKRWPTNMNSSFQPRMKKLIIYLTDETKQSLSFRFQTNENKGQSFQMLPIRIDFENFDNRYWRSVQNLNE